MTTIGEIYDGLIKEAVTYLDKSDPTVTGDIWVAGENLRHAREVVEEAEKVLLNVSKTAFERVFQEKAR